MQVENLTHPGQQPTDGDQILITYDNGATEKKQYWTPVAPEQAIPYVPRSLTMRQARLALLGSGMLNSVNSAVNALPSPQKEAAQIEWEYSNEVQRHNGFVELLTPSLGITSAQLDALFIAGALL